MFFTRLKIGLLLAGHTVAGLFLSRLNYNLAEVEAWDAWPIIGFFALVLAEAGLLGIWGGLGTTPPLLRLPAVEIATIYLCWVVVIAVPKWDKVFFASVTALLTVITLIVLSSLRHGRHRLRLVHSLADATVPSTPRPFQYAIWHILLATFTVAVVIRLGQFLRRPGDMIFGLLCELVLLHCVLASVWATLGTRLKLWRIVAVVVLGLLLGFVPLSYLVLQFYSLSQIVNGEVPWPPDVFFWPITFFFQSIIIVASLLVFRSSGYRLIRSTAG